MPMQVQIRMRLLQDDQVLFEAGQSWSSPEPLPAPEEEPIVYIPPPTTNVQTLELWYEQEPQAPSKASITP